jgi:predicted HD phosphohydrolase
MQDATRDDYQIVGSHVMQFMAGLPGRVLAHLELLAGDTGGYAVDRLTHSLQTATRADIGDTLGSYNHADLAATILEPFVSEKNHWIVKHHGVFQGYYFFHHLGLDRNMRDRYKQNEHFRDCAEFCAKYDQNSFDPDYETLPLEHFEPIVQRVFSAPRNSIYLSESA